VHRRLTETTHRLAMLHIALEGQEGCEVSTLELDRGGVSYTIDTLRALRRGAPAWEPVFILGLDALLEIHLWRDHLALIDEFDLVVVDRPGSDLDLLRGSVAREIADRIIAGGGERPGRGGRIYHLPIVPIPISSSEVRSLAASGAPLDGLVPLGVARYIHERGLYRQEATR
jgi:nicotinate-nucleotide adenylyltransferase